MNGTEVAAVSEAGRSPAAIADPLAPSGGRRGFTLAETAVALFLGLLLAAAALALVETVQQAEIRFWRVARRSASLRSAAERLGQAIRRAGLGSAAASPGFAPFAAAGPSSLIVLADLDGDGLLDGPGERVRHWLDGEILREESRPSAEGILRLAFTYRVAAGADGLPDGADNDGDGLVDERGEIVVTAAPRDLTGDGLDNDRDGAADEADEDQHRHVRLVEVELEGRGFVTEPDGPAAPSRTLRLAVRPRGGGPP